MYVRDTAEIARRVRAARTYAGLSQRELAELAGVEVKTVNRWERMQTRPDAGRIKAVIVSCGVRADWFDESFSLRDQSEVHRTNKPAEGDVRGMGIDLSLADDETEASGRTRA